MPIVSSMVAAGKGNRANKGAGFFPAGMIGSVPDSATFSGGNAPTHSDVSSGVPSVGVISQPEPVSLSPSGSGADAAPSGSDDVASFPSVPGDRGTDRGAAILGATKAVDPKLYADALEAVQAVITAEAAEPIPDFDAIDTLADIGRTLSAATDDTSDSLSVSGLL